MPLICINNDMMMLIFLVRWTELKPRIRKEEDESEIVEQLLLLFWLKVKELLQIYKILRILLFESGLEPWLLIFLRCCCCCCNLSSSSASSTGGSLNSLAQCSCSSMLRKLRASASVVRYLQQLYLFLGLHCPDFETKIAAAEEGSRHHRQRFNRSVLGRLLLLGMCK